MDGLLVGDGYDRQQNSDSHRNWESILEASCPCRSQNDQRLLRSIGYRGKRVAGKHCQPDQLADRLVWGVSRWKWISYQPILPGSGVVFFCVARCRTAVPEFSLSEFTRLIISYRCLSISPYLDIVKVYYCRLIFLTTSGMAADTIGKIADALFQVFRSGLVWVVLVAAVAGIGLQVTRVAGLAGTATALAVVQWEGVRLVELGRRPGLCGVAGGAVGGE